MNTRRNKHKHQFSRTRKAIRHHHLLVRMESLRCPSAQERRKAASLIDALLRDIRMKPLGKTHVYYVKVPEYNEGLTAITPIQTSHIAFHFWNRPDKAIMNDPHNSCLLQFDLYTCGTLSMGQVKKILDHLTEFIPRHVDLTLLNRNRSLEAEKHLVFDAKKDKCGWHTWLQRL